jgi:hypothetical protein
VKALAQVTLGLFFATGALLWCAWAVSIFLGKDLDKSAGLTEKLVYFGGRTVIWLGAVVVGGLVFGGAASVVLKALGGP